ncbi:MAG TPA: xanthine dehydrogenase family protein subunit M [Gemmatimonadaceae bacterium]|nr:xanthine dehydrogenase family protein subunit M [Gemmatimonadaceae bacterium]
MKPPPFEYRAPASVEEALNLLAEAGDDGKALAGGQSLIPLLNFRLARPSVLIDLNGIPSLSGITLTAEGSVCIGAMTRQRVLERSVDIRQCAPLITETMPHVAHPQIRNRGTIGGSLAHAEPAAELPAVMITLGARVRLQNKTGERWLSANDFFTGLFSTALETGELLTAVEVPAMPPRTGYAFEEFARRHGDFALLGVATTVTLDQSGICRDARITLVNPGAGAERMNHAAQTLLGSAPNAAKINEVAELVGSAITATADVHASAAYRQQLARVLTRRALDRAFSRALRA